MNAHPDQGAESDRRGHDADRPTSTPGSSSCSPPSHGSACSRRRGASGSRAARCRHGWTGSRGSASCVVGAGGRHRGARLSGHGVRHTGDPAKPRSRPGRSTSESIPEVLEAHTVTGPADLWCRVVARSNADLQLVLDRVLAHPEHRTVGHDDHARHPDRSPGAAPRGRVSGRRARRLSPQPAARH